MTEQRESTLPNPSPSFCSSHDPPSSPQVTSHEAEVIREAHRRVRERRVRAIHRDHHLSSRDKLTRIQQVMQGTDDDGPPPVRRRPRSILTESQWHDEEKAVLGCKHYARKCRIKAACCGEYFTCRLCHDEEMDHAIDRFATEQVECLVCEARDLPLGECCRNCGVKFADFYCGVCKFWVSNTAVCNKADQVYHCDDCGICRLGKGLSKHCHKCATCVSKQKFDVHSCRERMVDRSCPICTEHLAHSTKTVLQLKHCGHVIHLECLVRHFQLRYTCPVCMKAIRDMKSIFRMMDQMMEDEHKNMPAEYTGWISSVYCQDCYERSNAKYHFVYHRCGSCASYNTRVDRIFKHSTEKSAPKPAVDSDTAAPSIQLPSSEAANI